MDRRVRGSKKKAARAGRLLLLIGALAGVFWGARLVLVALFFTPHAQAAVKKIAEPFAAPDTRRFIFDRNFQELAVSFSFYAVYALPLQIVDPHQTAKRVSEILGEDTASIMELISKKRNFAWLADKVDERTASRLQKLDLPGIKLMRKSQRFYPNSDTAAHVIGFVKEGRGLAGVECYYDSLLRPEGLGYLLMDTGLLPDEKAKSAQHLVLTLDLRIQRLVEEKLASLVAETSAKGGGVVVMSAATGEILALASNPVFDPNIFWEAGESERNNRMTDAVVPCSVMERLNLGSIRLERDGGKATADLARAPLYWQAVADGLYVSPEISAQQLPILMGETCEAMLGYQMVGRKSDIDLPELQGKKEYPAATKGLLYEDMVHPCRVSALEALAGFSRVATGSIGVQPHLLLRLWDEKPGQIRANNGGKKDVDKEEFFAVESLAASTPAGNAEYGRREESPPLQQPDMTGRFHTLLLARAALGKEEIVMAVLLENARIPLEKPSPARLMSRKLAGRLQQWKIAAGSVPRSEKIKAKVAKLYREWQGEFESPDTGKVPIAQRRNKSVASRNMKMPDLKGYSVRRALQELQLLGVVARVNGSGWVSRQSPSPGTVVKGQKCALELTMARAELIKTISAEQ